MRANLSAVILAAGRGRRMKSSTPKVLHDVLGRPMLQYAIDAVKALHPKKIIVVIGSDGNVIREKIRDPNVTFVLQKRQRGTADALAAARRQLRRSCGETTIVLNGDCPLITSATLKRFLKKHRQSGNVLSFLSFLNNELSGYGRVIRDEGGSVVGIIEDKHAIPSEKKKFSELNGGVYLIESNALNLLHKIRKNPSSDEYYLTDLVHIISRKGGKIDAYRCAPEEIRGINSRDELCAVIRYINRKNIFRLIKRGVTFIRPDSSLVDADVSVGRDTIIYPNTYLEGRTRIGKKCVIFPGSRICHSRLDDEVTIKDNTLIEESKIGHGAVIGPCAHLRPGSNIGRGSRVGNFVEVKKTSLGDGSKASHLTYLGDADIGRGVNIGAGTITCNFDGREKHKTVIEAGAFIGSDCQLVAPVRIGEKALVAAGSTITNDVPKGFLAISRIEQRNLRKKPIRKRSGEKKKE